MSRPVVASGVLFVIPAYNEAANIGQVVRDLGAVVPGADVLVVDDGSRDDTTERAMAAGARVVRLPFNLGIGAAVQTGLIDAYRRGYEWALRMDGDGQHDPGDVQRFLAAMAGDKADLIIGSRFLRPGGDRTTLPRRVAIRFFNAMLSALTGFRITDATSGFVAVNRRAMSRLRHLFPDDYPEPECIVLMHRWGFQVAELPVTMRPRPAGRSSITATHSLYYMVKVTLAILLALIRYRRKEVAE